MFDSRLRALVDAPLNAAGRFLALRGVRSDQVTLVGFCFGILALPAVYGGYFFVALVLILVNRISDGLDGAVARATQSTDSGGYLDIVLDFLFYASIPFAFALHDPQHNAVSAAFLLFSFMGTGSSFLAFAIMAAKRGMETTVQGHKSIYYLQGLTEGSETIVFFVIVVLMPTYFPLFALVYGCMCWITTITRVLFSYKTLLVKE